MFLYYGLAVIGTRFGPRVVVPLYLLVLFIDVLVITSLVFNIGPVSLVEAAGALGAMNLTASAAYVGAAGAIVLTALAVIAFAVRLQNTWRRFAFLPVTLTVLLLGVFDAYVQSALTYSFGRFLSVAAPFESAAQRSGLEPAALAGETPSVLIVMVESWGALREPHMRAATTAPLRAAAMERRYRVRSGTTAYFGSTTNAELRELCGVWASYGNYMESADTGCLPARLRAAGYATTAYHGFSREMFERSDWYPNIGFDLAYFQEDLDAPGRAKCHTIFPGLCDREVAGDVRAALLEPGAPRLVDWLTLDSHLPVHPGLARATAACAGANPYGDDKVCMLADVWRQVFELVADIAADPRLPPTNILVVGDHIPPFWERDTRALFEHDRVPWLYLENPLSAGGRLALAGLTSD
jgi:hypothetical protein